MRLAERTTSTLTELLHDRGISDASAGAMIGRSKAYVQRRLSGTVVPDLSDVEELAGCAGLEVRLELVPREDQP